MVRDLFYNTPARLKFMKRDTVEASQVAGTVQRQALAHPDVAFRLIKDGESVLQTAGNGDLHGTIYQVFGRQLAVDMVEVKSQWENLRLEGYVTKPTATRGNRNYQQFFVNGRPVKSRLMTAALEEAYANQMMTGRFPGCVLCLELPRQAVDVNVHPAKTEVKFANERAVFDCIRFGVLSALNKTPGRPAMQLEKEKPAAVQAAPAAPAVSAAPKSRETFRTMTPAEYKTFTEVLSAPVKKPVAPPVEQALRPRVPPVPDRKPDPVLRQEIFTYEAASRPPETPMQPPVQKTAEIPEQTVLPIPEAPAYRVVGEVLDTYILIEQGDAVLFLDKHAAHERILFEKLKAQTTDVMAQALLTPISASFTPEETGALLENGPLLARYGYEVEDFGGGDLLIRRIPAELDPGQAQSALEELAAGLLEGMAKDPEALRDAALHTIACKAAIKAGWHTEPAERDALVRQVMERDDIKYCPHGRPVMVTLTKKQLEKQFKRT